MKNLNTTHIKVFVAGLVAAFLLILPTPSHILAATESGSVGIEGKISAPPPTQAPTIISPVNGRVFTELPVTVSGSCANGLLVKLFKNNVFSGSANCTGGSFSIIIDLFSGQNDLVARVYDALDQPSPDSNTVTVQFNDARAGISGPRVTLTSVYAKRGAFPNEKLSFPIILSGGTGPYAISVDWGDGKALDLFTQQFPGTFTIEHAYENPGIYNILIKAVDKNGTTAYLQLVGIGNGALTDGDQPNQTTVDGKTVSGSGSRTITRIIWWPAVVALPMILITFWLGRRHALFVLRRRIEKGQRAF